jgi:hypothetical protein
VGDISGVSADLRTFVARDPAEGGRLEPANDSAVLLLRFAGGGHGTIQVSAVAQTAERNQEQHVVLYGEEGTIEVDFTMTAGTEIRVAGQQGPFAVAPVPDRFWGTSDRSRPLMQQIAPVFVRADRRPPLHRCHPGGPSGRAESSRRPNYAACHRCRDPLACRRALGWCGGALPRARGELVTGGPRDRRSVRGSTPHRCRMSRCHASCGMSSCRCFGRACPVGLIECRSTRITEPRPWSDPE